MKRTEKKFSIFFAVGVAQHTVCYSMDAVTLRSRSSYWILLLIATLIGFWWVVKKEALLDLDSYNSDHNYQKRLFQVVFLVLAFGFSSVMFGAYLNTAALGLNSWISKDVNQTETFTVLSVTSTKPGLAKRSDRWVPCLKIQNERFTDHLELNSIDFEDFDQNQQTIRINHTLGILNWGVIQDVQLD
ncbi:MAG: hypothetical protein AAF598_04105 [Bacteroidota bacterium]